MGYKAIFLKTKPFCSRIPELAASGVKAIMFAGEGEPLLHRDIEAIAETTFKNGIDVAFTTNGTLFSVEKAKRLLPVSKWIKVSCNAGTANTYSHIHGCKETDFQKVINNLAAATALKKKYDYSCTLGIQTILLPENKNELKELAQISKDIDLDYFVVKPYSQHPQSITDQYAEVSYEECRYLSRELEEHNTESFKVIFRNESMKGWDEQMHGYRKCLALPFWSYIDAGGNIYGCSMFLGEDELYYGNIYDSSFQEIWEGEKRKASLQWVQDSLDIRNCRINCRMNKINQYLWDLKHPPEHVNFI